jgi:hypothetical protein
MLGFAVVVMGAAVLMSVISFDVIHSRFKSSRAGRFGRSISESANVNLAAYELSFLMIFTGLPLAAQENQDPFLLDAFPVLSVVVFCTLTLSGIACLNIMRFERFGLAEKQKESIYALAEELIGEYESPDEGVETAVVYVRNNSRMHGHVSVEGFLSQLATRGGSIAQIASRRLQDLEKPA